MVRRSGQLHWSKLPQATEMISHSESNKIETPGKKSFMEAFYKVETRITNTVSAKRVKKNLKKTKSFGGFPMEIGIFLAGSSRVRCAKIPEQVVESHDPPP
jgi:hypothetical protein